MKNKLTLIVILLIVAVVISYLVYSSGAPQPAEQESPIQQLTLTTEEKKAILNFPAADASEGEQQRYFELAERLAQQSGVLDVTNCNLQPLVLNADLKSDIILKNTSDYDITLDIENESNTVPANQEVVIKVDFGKGGGLYGYGCNSANPDGSSSGSGLILVGAE
ncbi:MAG: hypothetical protein KJI72_01545 [Patescibacteria group bacterium]|nr:hypothetical protein [Patescibacteria group bacterium]